MEAHAAHAHHAMPTEGKALTGVAVSATLHCLTGCAIGEVAGVAIGTALGWSNLATIALAVALAFLFGYSLTSLPLLRAGLALSAVIPIALAADTLSIATMEIVDNAVMLLVPGAMEAGLGELLFWGSLSFALVVAFVLTVPVNRWLIGRGKGHTAVHETGIHGGPSPRVVGAGVVVAAIFGIAVLVGEAIGSDEAAHGHESAAMSMAGDAAPHSDHSEEAAMTNEPTAGSEVSGLTATADGVALELANRELPQGEATELRFQVLGADGAPVTDFDVEHGKRMHVIVVRRDLTGFQHLHPTMDGDGVWTAPIELSDAGTYRVFADFASDGEDQTLGADLMVDGTANHRALPAPASEAETDSGYRVELGEGTAAGGEQELAFEVTRNGEPIDVEPYLGADGHLVALREGDLAYLHVHPLGSAGHGRHGEGEPAGEAIRFATAFPTAGTYRLFLQFKDDGEVHTAAFTKEVAAG